MEKNHSVNYENFIKYLRGSYINIKSLKIPPPTDNADTSEIKIYLENYLHHYLPKKVA
jgi:hypothetical protein